MLLPPCYHSRTSDAADFPYRSEPPMVAYISPCFVDPEDLHSTRVSTSTRMPELPQSLCVVEGFSGRKFLREEVLLWCILWRNFCLACEEKLLEEGSSCAVKGYWNIVMASFASFARGARSYSMVAVGRRCRKASALSGM